MTTTIKPSTEQIKAWEAAWWQIEDESTNKKGKSRYIAEQASAWALEQYALQMDQRAAEAKTTLANEVYTRIATDIRSSIPSEGK